MAITVTKGLIGKEDISFSPAGVAPETFSRTAAGNTSQTITKLAPSQLNIRDVGNYIAATNLEDAIQEVSSKIAALQQIATAGKGPDIPSSTVLQVPDNSLYFEVTGTIQINAILQSTVAAGRRLILRFMDSVPMEPTNLLFLSSGRFTAQVNDHMEFINDGNIWYELSRWTDHGWKLHDGYPSRALGLAEGIMYATGGDIDRPSGVYDKFSIGSAFSTDPFGDRF